MNKYFILFYLVICNFTLSAQNEILSGKAQYNLTVTHNPKFDALSDRLKSHLLKSEEEANSLIFCLNFTANESSFATCSKDEAIKSGLFTKSNKTVHANFETKVLSYNNSSGASGSVKENTYIIEEKRDYIWVLTKETKVIDGYTCYKATTTYIYETKIPEEITVTAWYCPTIPFQTGPNGYFGLPGLIMELQDKNTVFGLVELSLSKETIKLEKPKPAIVISKLDYTNLINQKIKEE